MPKDYDMYQLKQDVDYIKKKVRRLDTTVHGPRDSAEPKGVIHEVGRNTQHRKNMTRAFWIVFSGEVGIIIYLLQNTI